MAKDTIEISSLKEGESRILTKNGNGYSISKIEDNPDYLGEYAQAHVSKDLVSEYYKAYEEAFESASYKQGGLTHYYDMVAKEKIYSQSFAKVDLERLSCLSENAQNNLDKILELNSIIKYYINTDDLIGRVIETVENNTNKSYTIKKKTNTTETMMTSIKNFCEQIDIGYVVGEVTSNTFAKGTTIMYLMGDNQKGWHLSFYPLGVCEITPIEEDHEPLVVMNVSKLVSNIQRSLGKYFTGEKYQGIIENKISSMIENNYPPEVYEAYVNKEQYALLNNERCSVVRVNKGDGLYGLSAIVKGLKSEIMLETIDAVDRKNLIDRAKKIYFQKMRKECLDKDNNKIGNLPNITGFLQQQLMFAMQQEDVIYTAPPYAESLEILEPKVELTPSEKIMEYRNRLLSALGISFISAEDGSSYTVTNLNYSELLKSINKISKQLEPIFNKYFKLLCFEKGYKLEKCPTMEIESTELISMESKVALINTYYTTLGLSRETTFKVLGIDIDIETQRRKQENDKGLNDIFEPYQTSYNTAGDKIGEEKTEVEKNVEGKNSNNSKQNKDKDKQQIDKERRDEQKKETK
ncbi:hypothetical protein [Clostridium sp.]|uniref:hypothetical protein n=1 Tax=Clostridium sp. TaxID=1506 RepID=UPI0025BD7A93|nr:hypothetical protein [Clostridium sp.]